MTLDRLRELFISIDNAISLSKEDTKCDLKYARNINNNAIHGLEEVNDVSIKITYHLSRGSHFVIDGCIYFSL